MIRGNPVPGWARNTVVRDTSAGDARAGDCSAGDCSAGDCVAREATVPDSGVQVSGVDGAGGRFAGAREASPREASPREAGPREASPREAGPRGAGPREAGPREAGPREASPRGAGVQGNGVRDPAAPGNGPTEAMAQAMAADAWTAAEAPDPAPEPARVLTEHPTRAGLGRFVTKLAAPHRWWLAGSIVLTLVAAGLAVLTPVIIGRITDAVLAGDPDATLRLGVAGVGVALAAIVAEGACAAALARLGEYVVRDLRERVADALLAAPLRVLERHRAGELLQRATAEIAALSAFVRDSLPLLAAGVATLLVTVVVLAVESWVLLLATLAAFVPAAAGLLWRFRRAAPVAYAAEAAAEAEVIDGFAEIARVRSVLRHARPAGRALFAGREAARNERSVAAQLRTTRLGWWVEGVSVVEGVCLAVLLLAGAALVARDAVSVGVVVTFVLAGRALFAGFSDVASLAGAAVEAATGAARAADLLEVCEVSGPSGAGVSGAGNANGAGGSVGGWGSGRGSVLQLLPWAGSAAVGGSGARRGGGVGSEEGSGGGAAGGRSGAGGSVGGWGSCRGSVLQLLPSADTPGLGVSADDAAALVVEGVSFSYDGVPVLVGQTLRVGPGERVCLVGRTGAGKSTLAKLMAGLYRPDAGSVRYGGVDLADVQPHERASCVAYVPQTVHLGVGSISAALRLAAPGASDAELLATADRLGLGEWLRGLPAGLETSLGAAEALSVGERQLVGIVRIALLDARVLVLDEITADLDPRTATLVESALAALVGHGVAAPAHVEKGEAAPVAPAHVEKGEAAPVAPAHVEEGEVAPVAPATESSPPCPPRALVIVAHRPETIAAAGRIHRVIPHPYRSQES